MGFSTTELMIVLAIVLVLFGAKKIPELAKGLGRGIKDFKTAIKEDEEVEKVEEHKSAAATEISKDKEKA